MQFSSSMTLIDLRCLANVPHSHPPAVVVKVSWFDSCVTPLHRLTFKARGVYEGGKGVGVGWVLLRILSPSELIHSPRCSHIAEELTT